MSPRSSTKDFNLVANGSVFSRRYRMTFIISIETIIFSSLILIIFPEINPVKNIIILSIAITLIIINLLLIKFYHCVEFSSHFLTFIIFTTILASNYIAGGSNTSLFVWFYLIPIISAVLTGFKGFLIYGFLSIISMLAFLFLPFPHPIQLPESMIWRIELANFCFSMLLIFSIIAAFLYEINLFERKTMTQQDALEADREKFIHLSRYDLLTKLPNRNYFYDELTKRINAHQQFIIFYMDLNNFKEVNDIHGHEVGDKILVETAKRLTNCFREQDHLVRMGGDEFLGIVSYDKNVAIANQIKSRINEVFRYPYRSVDQSIQLNIAIGLSKYPKDSNNITKLLAIADKRMYQNKKELKNEI